MVAHWSVLLHFSSRNPTRLRSRPKQGSNQKSMQYEYRPSLLLFVTSCRRPDATGDERSTLGINSLDDSIEKLIKNLQAATSRRANCHVKAEKGPPESVNEENTRTIVTYLLGVRGSALRLSAKAAVPLFNEGSS
ncbi:hypothetical protein M404DRAFT_302943 [Pisolithus tinctorius Marx 270]|uniref:Uncharacterized protein n=1 Tax=Pisolithus tinctorius Marx 270 TaxID=870435 RepID=A0A0C3PK32_PISTI|nr:hypothetical protein M404DRAFT_302943 [Pisolithus tinctorius Marx 270]